MAEIVAKPIDAEAFRSFGEVLLSSPDTTAPWNGRPGAGAVIEMLSVHGPTEPTSHRLEVLERHAHSTQAFFPLDRSDYLVVVAPDAPDGGPDLSAIRAFAVPGNAVVQYHPAVWHAPLATLGGEGRFVMLVHKDGSAADCQFVEIPPTVVGLAPSCLDEMPKTSAPTSTGDTADAHE